MTEVGVAQLRQDLKAWIARANSGDEIIVTDRGRPVARLTGIETPRLVDELAAQGVLSPPEGPRPHARGTTRIHIKGPVSEYVVGNARPGAGDRLLRQ